MSRRSSDILAYAELLGYELVRHTGSGHRMMRHKHTKRCISIPSTPGFGRSTANTEAQLRSAAGVKQRRRGKKRPRRKKRR